MHEELKKYMCCVGFGIYIGISITWMLQEASKKVVYVTSDVTNGKIINIINFSVYRGNDASLNRPTTVLLSTVLMYLLVRML